MTRTKIVLETFLYWLCDHLTRLLAREYLIEFSGSENFKHQFEIKNVNKFFIVQKIPGIIYQGKNTEDR
jgi:hypothetical protein